MILSILILVSIDAGLKFIKFLSLIFAVLNLYDRELFLSLYISFIELRDILEVLFNLEVFAENLLFFLIKFPNWLFDFAILIIWSCFSVSYSKVLNFLCPDKLIEDVALPNFLLFLKKLFLLVFVNFAINIINVN